MSDETAPDAVVTWAGSDYPLRVAEMSAMDVAEFRTATGRSVTQVKAEIGAGAADLDTVAALLWLARRQRGEIVEYDALAGSITYASAPTVSFTVDDDEDADDGGADPNGFGVSSDATSPS